MSQGASDTVFISVFTPSQTDNETLESIFVGRHALLDDATERIGESAATGNKHHMLYVGPRGSGKTHLVTLLVHRLSQRPDITQDLQIAWLNEDETSTTLLDLLLHIYRALAKRYPDTYDLESVESVYDLSVDEAQAFMTDVLLKATKQEKTILTIVENLDALFEGLGDVGQKKLRALIQEHPHFALVATAQKLSEELKKRSNPFFGFFQTTHFKPLSEAEAAELLRKISELNERPKVAEFLRTDRGRARIRALHHLSGGNHRMYIVLSQFITQDSVDALVTPFVKMVDELTPYYQERLRWLPPQQRKIVEFLSTSTHTVTVKEIAKRLFATPQTISSQLKDLSEKGYVTSTKRGRESLYEITEPLMRICVEVKENQSHEPLALLVEFIRAWYDLEDLAQRLDSESVSSTAYSYLEIAFRKSLAQREEELNRLKQETYELEQKNHALENYTTFFFQASNHLKSQEFEKAIAEATNALNVEGMSTKDVAWAFIIRGLSYAGSNQIERAIADYSTAINIENVPKRDIAFALLQRGIAFKEIGKIEKSSDDYNAAANLGDGLTELLTIAYIYSSNNYFSTGRWSEGMLAFRKGLVLSVNTTPIPTHDISPLIATIFSTTLEPTTRKRRIAELIQLYAEYEAVTATLGTGLIEHLGSLYQSDGELPSPENLEQWLSAWEEASEGVDKLRISMRIFRTGVAFLKTGGEDRGILADLTESERSILRQALGLEET